MDRKNFAELLSRYLAGKASATEKKVVEQWYALLEEDPRKLQEEEWVALEKRLWSKLEESAGLAQMKVSSRESGTFIRNLALYLSAACVAIALIVGYTRLFSSSELGQLEEGQVAITNEKSIEMRVLLEDGSVVLLSPGAELRYPEHFPTHQRVVTLLGEAFFEISENANRPFLVNAGKITTKVLGTSFRVKAAGKSKVEVSVRTGKVSVFQQAKLSSNDSRRKNNGVILTPNHQATFLPEQEVFVTELVANPLPLQHDVSFVFDDIALAEILHRIEKAYAINFELEKDKLGACPLTANLSNRGLYAQLDLICAAIQGSYELKGTTILISGKGCE
ncbi:FecR family protein [Dyadobacter tibetensis]|uniref:FecR family protein n=1 Tax=Dyadobacter tibetensis TaxID=1211851 RepID=UPI00047257C8|nr:FecR family protein [Dyadobacter tibetensis]